MIILKCVLLLIFPIMLHGRLIKMPEFTPVERLMMTLPNLDDLSVGCNRIDWLLLYKTILSSAFLHRIRIEITADWKTHDFCFASFKKMLLSFDPFPKELFENEPVYWIEKTYNQPDNTLNNWQLFPFVRSFKAGIVKDDQSGLNVIIDGNYPETKSHRQFGSIMQRKNLFSISRSSKLNVIDTEISLDFKNVLVNGCGICILSRKVFEKTQVYLGSTLPINDSSMAKELSQLLGCNKAIFLETLYGEPSGSVDFYMFFLSPNHLVYFMYSKTQDEINWTIMQRNLQKLQAFFTVTVFPMPSRVSTKSAWPSFAHVLQLNSDLLVPSTFFLKSDHQVHQKYVNDLQNLLDSNNFIAKKVIVLKPVESLLLINGGARGITATINAAVKSDSEFTFCMIS